MKKRILGTLLCIMLIFSAVKIAPGASAGGDDYPYMIENASAAKLAEFFSTEIAELSGNTVKIIKDFDLWEVCSERAGSSDCTDLYIDGLSEDIIIDLNGHAITSCVISLFSKNLSDYSITLTDSVGSGKVTGLWDIIYVHNIPIIFDGGTYVSQYSCVSCTSDIIDINILSGSFYTKGYPAISIYVSEKTKIEKLNIADGVLIKGEESYAHRYDERPELIYNLSHGIEITSIDNVDELTGNPIEIGAAHIKGGDIVKNDSVSYMWTADASEDAEEFANAIYSDVKIKLKISKAAVLDGGAPGGIPINVPEGSEIEWINAPMSDRFVDVDSGKWYTEYVDYVAENKLMNGMSENTFAPSDTLTRAMFVQILANAAGVDTSNRDVTTKFTDVPSGKWYTPAVKWASENDIVNGMTENTFDPQGNIQRQQMCVMLARFAKAFGIELGGSAEKAAFSDDNLIQNYAKEAVYTCQQAGIISGMTPDTFAPRDNATRAQIAKIMTVFHRDFMTAK